MLLLRAVHKTRMKGRVKMNEITNRLMQVINALNNIDVKGKTNLMNLGGCIAILEEICGELPRIASAGNGDGNPSSGGDE